MKYMNTVCGHNTEFIEVKFGVTYRNHCILSYTGHMFMSVLCSSQLDPASTEILLRSYNMSAGIRQLQSC